MDKYDIRKPFVLPVGMYRLNSNDSINFQLNRLVNFNLGDLEEVRRIGAQIKDLKSWKTVLLQAADEEYEKGRLKSAMGFYRMAEFYMDYEDPDALMAWKKARKLFFQYYEDFFTGENPIVEKWNVPYEDYSMPVLKMKSGWRIQRSYRGAWWL